VFVLQKKKTVLSPASLEHTGPAEKTQIFVKIKSRDIIF
jgi:hypothetical protein